jgi:hypothetical protein
MGDTQVSNISATKGHVQALLFAAKGGTALSELLGSIATTKEMERRGPIQTMLFLETHFSDDEAHSIPVVGSKMGETGNKPYDRYTVEVKTQDGKRKVPGSWYSDAVKNTSEGIRILERIEKLDAGQGESIPADILAMGSAQKAEEKVKLRQRLADMRTGLTKGAMLFHQAEEISNINPARIKVRMPIFEEKDWQGKGVQVVKGNLIRLQDPTGELEEEVVTVGQFLQYDAAATKADKDGGTLKSLKATAARAPKKKAGTATPGQGTAYVAPTTLEQCLTLFNVLATALDNGTDHGKKMESMLLSACAKEGAEGDEAVVSIGGVCLAADSVWTVISTRYNTIQERKAATLNVKAAV